ncbi:MAG: hypothetical protein KBE38_14620 [Ignavibacterium sp.]|nr:hypothetical protein [Ignavibacterium sp.]
MANDKLNTKEIFAGIKKEFWQDTATKTKAMIRSDMESGEVQEYTTQTRPTKAGAKNYSFGYKKYKTNYMNRFTDGKKLKSHAGRSVVDNTTNSVNMRLTGKTIEGLHLDQILINGFILSYMEADRKKIEGNAEMGRLITTLNDKNKDKVLNLYADALDVSLRKWAQKELVIKVGN